MRRELRLTLQAGAVLLLALMIGLFARSLLANRTTVFALVNDGQTPRAPDFTLPRLNGHGRASLASLRGRVVLLNFWASWCTPCRAEFPRLRAVAATGDVRVLGVVFHDTAAPARSFMAAEHGTWPALLDPKHQIADAYGVRLKPGIPVTFAIDRAGTIRLRHLGEATDADIRQLVAAAQHP